MRSHRFPSALRGPNALIVAIIALAAFLPFVNRPVWFDDHAIFQEVLDVASGRNALPFRQVAHEAGWIPGETPTEANPPAFAFLVGSVARVVGTEFWKSHLFLMLLQIGGLLCFYGVARRLVDDAFWASLLLLFSPAHFLTGYSLLVDGLLAPAIAASLWAWMRGEETSKPGWFLLGVFLAGCAALVKYTGLIAAGLLCVRILMGPRMLWARRFVWLAVPLAMLAAWWLATRAMYGESHFSAVARDSVRAPDAARLFLLAAFAAATIPAVPLLAAAAAGRSRWATPRLLHIVLIVAGIVAGALLLPGGAGLALGLAAGLFLSWAWAAVRERGNKPAEVFLGAWAIAAILGLSIARGWICARYLVIAAPAMVLLTVRRLESKGVSLPWKAASVAVSAALTLTLAQADTRRAFVEQAAGAELNRWARTQAGARAYYPAATPTGLGFYLDPKLWTPAQPGFALNEGDFVVVPFQTLPPRFAPTYSRFVPVAEISYASKNPVRLLDRGSLAGFYGSIWGPLPFSFSRQPLERFIVLQAQAAPRPS